jgi:3-phenylpropionate/trans-cinnamate dioxygenase ferredoxin component
MSDWLDVAPVAELPPGGKKVIDTEAGPIAVFNLDGEFYAIEDLCSHDGGDLASGRCDGDQIICPRHGARFCIRTGKALTRPAYEDIEAFPVRLESGMVQVDIGL